MKLNCILGSSMGGLLYIEHFHAFLTPEEQQELAIVKIIKVTLFQSYWKLLFIAF